LEKQGHGFMDNWITGHGKVWITTHRSPPPGFNLTKDRLGNWELMWSDIDPRIYTGVWHILQGRRMPYESLNALLPLAHRHSALPLCLPEAAIVCLA
jgi:hypothetical protein